ncbi:MAG: TolC family protein, partial [Flavobacteriaceae bacterium]|nr:TolC family protein [Flavobacteriaceae bacterium]
DPELSSEFSQKKFDDKNYYTTSDSYLKIPTWYGVSLVGGIETSSGVFLNPQNFQPQNGLAYLGLEVNLLENLVINPRRAVLKQAQENILLSEAEQELQAIEVLYGAAEAYLLWYIAVQKLILFEDALENISIRNEGIKTLIENGDRAGIDSIEAGINFDSRKIQLYEAQIDVIKTRLQLSNFLWDDSLNPLEVQENAQPDALVIEDLEQLFIERGWTLEQHPKVRILQQKRQIQEIEVRLKRNQLLPTLDLKYNLVRERTDFPNLATRDFTVGAGFSMPLFLRKERGALRAANLKLQEIGYSAQAIGLEISNQIIAQRNLIDNLKAQRADFEKLIGKTQQMLAAEEELFQIGESSIFMINQRENALIDRSQKALDLEFKFLKSYFELGKVSGFLF